MFNFLDMSPPATLHLVDLSGALEARAVSGVPDNLTHFRLVWATNRLLALGGRSALGLAERLIFELQPNVLRWDHVYVKNAESRTPLFLPRAMHSHAAAVSKNGQHVYLSGRRFCYCPYSYTIMRNISFD